MDIGSILKDELTLAEKAVTIPRNPEADFPLLSAKIKLTWRCNLKCRMCNLWRESYQMRQGGIGFETAKKLIVSLKQLGTRKVHFSGGEVFLLPYFTDLVSFARYNEMQVNITTNGTLITKETARILVDERVHTVIVSIDSHDKKEHDSIRGKKGAFKSAWEGIQLLQKRKEVKGRGPKIAVNTVVTRKTIESMDALYDLLCAKGVDSWRLLPVDSELKKIRPTEEQWHVLLEKLGEWDHILARMPLDWSSDRSGLRAAGGKFAGVFYGENICFAPWFNIFINADGNVYPCCMGKQDMLPYGNINNETLEMILSGSIRRDICCSMASGHIYPACECCDDFLEENRAFNALL